MRRKRTKQRIKDAPESVQPFLCHGVHIEKNNSKEWLGDCPFCGKDNHFYVNSETGQYNCKVCDASGNGISFLTWYADKVYKETTAKEFKQFSKSRGTVKIGRLKYFCGLPTKIIRNFKIGFDSDNNRWVIPIRGENGKVRDLRRYENNQIFATTGIKLQLGGADRLAKLRRNGTVWLCEGEFDAVVMQWLLTELGRTTSDCVAWVPGAGILKDEWVKHFKGREVIAVYDNDNPGDQGQIKAYNKLKGVAKKLSFINWPESKPKGFDLRDFLIRNFSQDTPPRKILKSLLELKSDKPRREDEITEDNEESSTDSEETKLIAEEEELEEATLEEVIKVFNDNILMNQDNEDALKVCLAVCLSNLLPSDPLWLYLIGPPGAGKTLLLSSLQKSRRCKFVSTITPHSLVSGWQGTGKDPSLIPKLKGKTFVLKDFTEILSMQTTVQEEIFSTLRGAYDGRVEKPFGNGVIREYVDCHFSMIAGVTHAIHGHSKASLGERFIKFQMRKLEKNQAEDLVLSAIFSIGKEKARETEMQEVVQRFLKREVDVEKLPTIPVSFAERLTSLVQLIALMRTQVEMDFKGEQILYRPEVESGTRLAKQLSKLAILLSVIENKKEVDEEIFKLVTRVAYNTAYGYHLDIIEAIMEIGGEATSKEISEKAEIPIMTLRPRLDALIAVKAIKIKAQEKDVKRAIGRPSKFYEVLPEVQNLWKLTKGMGKKKITKTREKVTKKRVTKKRVTRRRKVSN